MANNFANNNNMTAIMTAIGNKIKNAGHTIYNSAGAALAKRSNLQFTGRLKTVDNSTDNITVVDDSPEHIEWDDWLIMSDQERANVKEAVIDNAPGVDGGLTANLLTKLWENPNPSSTFASQNITLASDDYDFLMFVYKNTAGSTIGLSAIIPKGSNAMLVYSYTTSSGIFESRRQITYQYNLVVSADNAYSSSTGSSAHAQDNNACIPIAIYGIKKTINLKFSAIASDISTAADHCIMSDGVTNVEDEIMAMKQPRTIVCGVITGTISSYITFAYDFFPKNVASARITKVFPVGLAPQPAVNIPIVFDKTSGTDWAIAYANISDTSMLDYMRAYPTLVEIEITYS